MLMILVRTECVYTADLSHTRMESILCFYFFFHFRLFHLLSIAQPRMFSSNEKAIHIPISPQPKVIPKR